MSVSAKDCRVNNWRQFKSIILEEIKMNEKNENTFQETEAAFAFAIVLLNFLILAIDFES